jgi:hypothetical protein
MPSLYAHNKFGKLVIAGLSKEEKEIIRQYPRSFRIGLQGPDFLFFYKAYFVNKINQTGVKYHHQDAYPFMENAVKIIQEYGKDSPEYSYILGFICHFVLDNACHPYINKFIDKTGCGHIEIEGDLDRLIISSDGYVPQYYPMHKLIPTDFDTAMSIEPFFKDSYINAHVIQGCLKWMRLIKRFFVAPRKTKRTLIDFCMRSTFHYKKLKGHVVLSKPNKKCQRESDFLYFKLKGAVEDAWKLIGNFQQAVEDSSELSPDFHKDFNGNSFL